MFFLNQLKGCPPDRVKEEVNEMIDVLGLEAKRNKFSSTLSGGQKRKLSVGIALIAGSKVSTKCASRISDWKGGVGTVKEIQRNPPLSTKRQCNNNKKIMNI